MPDLKLAKLPDRRPVKLSISVSPDLHAALRDYAETYREAYGTGESIAELIPYMLSAFINDDVFFKKARRERKQAAVSAVRPKKQPPTRVPPAPAPPNLDRS
jgi:hypothetical protein